MSGSMAFAADCFASPLLTFSLCFLLLMILFSRRRYYFMPFSRRRVFVSLIATFVCHVLHPFSYAIDAFRRFFEVPADILPPHFSAGLSFSQTPLFAATRRRREFASEPPFHFDTFHFQRLITFASS